MSKAGATEIGLCARCRHARTIETRRSVFWLCGLAATDPAFPKYPRLPVNECAGFDSGEPVAGAPGHPPDSGAP